MFEAECSKLLAAGGLPATTLESSSTKQGRWRARGREEGASAHPRVSPCGHTALPATMECCCDSTVSACQCNPRHACTAGTKAGRQAQDEEGFVTAKGTKTLLSRQRAEAAQRNAAQRRRRGRGFVTHRHVRMHAEALKLQLAYETAALRTQARRTSCCACACACACGVLIQHVLRRWIAQQLADEAHIPRRSPPQPRGRRRRRRRRQRHSRRRCR